MAVKGGHQAGNRFFTAGTAFGRLASRFGALPFKSETFWLKLFAQSVIARDNACHVNTITTIQVLTAQLESPAGLDAWQKT